MSQKYTFLFLCCSLLISLQAQQTVGVFYNDPSSFNGYTLFNPHTTNTTYMMDNCGNVVHSWTSDFLIGNTFYLLPSGHLLRGKRLSSAFFNIGGAAGGVELFNWNGNLINEFTYSNDTVRHHHDIAPLPNGNVLMVAFELRTAAQAIAAGRDPNLLPDQELWPEHIIEIQVLPNNQVAIVWEWHLWDHLVQDFDPTKDNFGVVGDHPELLDVNFVDDNNGAADWLHANAVDYNPELDQILINSPFQGEFYILDHSTTTEEAAEHTGGNSGKGGDFLYRWGNPQSYDQGMVADKKLQNQHDAHWIPAGLHDAGKILVFNNGNDRGYSSVDMIEPPLMPDGSYEIDGTGKYGPDDLFWSYTDPIPTNFFSSFLSGAQQQPNGNILINSGAQGTFFEVEMDTQMPVWHFVNPVTNNGVTPQGSAPIGNNIVFRATRLSTDHPALEGRDLSPGSPIEADPIANNCTTCKPPEISTFSINNCNVPVVLDWAPIYGAMQYQFFGQRASTGMPQLTRTISNSTFNFNGSVPNGFGVEIQLRTMCPDGSWTEWTPLTPYTISCDDPMNSPTPFNSTFQALGFNSDMANAFNIYPNPTSDILNIETSFEDSFDLKIYDLIGHEIQRSSQIINHTSLDLSYLQNGAYIIRITYDKQQLVKKFLKF